MYQMTVNVKNGGAILLDVNNVFIPKLVVEACVPLGVFLGNPSCCGAISACSSKTLAGLASAGVLAVLLLADGLNVAADWL
jgi:hypothetical protein